MFEASPADPNQMLYENSSPRQKVIEDEEDGMKSFAATLRNPAINKHNILDSMADLHEFLTLKR